jgi:hypothetical protein
MNEVHQAKSSLNRKLHKPANHYFPVCKVFKPVGWAKTSLARSGSTSKGGRTGERNGACVGRPRLKGLGIENYAALAFLAAVGRAGFGWAFAAVFLAACAFSFAANSALTFCAMASVSTL